MTTKERKEIKQKADDAVKKIAESFVELFTKKVTEITDEFHNHLDQHMEELEDCLELEFEKVHEHLGSLERLEKLEKKVKDLEKLDERVEKRYIT